MKHRGLAFGRLLLLLALVFIGGALFSRSYGLTTGVSDVELVHALFGAAALFGMSFLALYASSGTRFPSFVVALLFGMAGQPLFQSIMGTGSLLSILVGVSAIYILFAGGIETPFHHFRQALGKIFSLSFLGLGVSALLFSVVVLVLGSLMGQSVSVSTAVLLGALLASTDPAAIVPIMKTLRFHRSITPTIIIAESAMTDAVGALLTITFLGLAATQVSPTDVFEAFGVLAKAEVALQLGKEVLIGAGAGVLGSLILYFITRGPHTHETEHSAETAAFYFVPLVSFLTASLFGGSGYLAVFVTGLFVSLNKSLRQTNQFFNESIDAFLKPVIFLLLGALVQPEALWQSAGMGIAAAVLFMGVVRPLSVWVSLGPALVLPGCRLHWRDLLFISFVRETGAIPAVLLVTIAGLGLPESGVILSVGMWVILLTLLIQPVLTPKVADWLGVAEPIDDGDVLEEVSDKPFALLGTRGFSFLRRLPAVVDWSVKHGVYEIVVLLCLEGRYSKELERQIEGELEAAKEAINADLKAKHRKRVDIRLLSHQGFLQNNIETIAKKEDDLAIIFIGKRVLDYRLEDIRQLPVPLYFLD